MKQFCINAICDLHGADFFINLLNCLNGAEWTKKDEAGELGDNFRKLVKLGIDNSTKKGKVTT